MTTYKRHPLNKKRPAPHVIRAQRLQRTGITPSDMQQLGQAIERLVPLVGRLTETMSDALGRVVRSLPPRPVTRTRYTPPTN